MECTIDSQCTTPEFCIVGECDGKFVLHAQIDCKTRLVTVVLLKPYQSDNQLILECKDFWSTYNCNWYRRNGLCCDPDFREYCKLTCSGCGK